ncbi:MAG: hypothetical protein GY929_07670 [Actinomycetia bacterium]|nr:hypothetical protein [Actinomycetes bacterium]
MRRIATTVIALVGPDASPAVAALGAARNVVGLSPDPDSPDLDRAVEAWRTAETIHTRFTVHDADPLAAVAAAWAAMYDRQGVRGDLEVLVAETVARWRAGSLELPDYYLVLDPHGLHLTPTHWYLGVLHSAAPGRVVPVPPATPFERVIGSLPAGRWWPDLPELLDGIEHIVPDRAGTDVDGATNGPTGLLT